LKIQELNVYIVVRNDDRVLVLRRKDGFWEFPGGGVDWGEDPEQAAKRELREETKIIPNAPFSLIGVTSAVYKKGEDDKHSVYLVYETRTEKTDVFLSGEHTEYRWLNKMEASFLKYGLNAEPIIHMI